MNPTVTAEQITQKNVEKVQALERATQAKATIGDRVAEAVARWCGSMPFVVMHVVWYGIWIMWNTTPHKFRFDPFPFSLLTLVVSLEAIFLSVFILVAQNRQTSLSERRAHLDLQINMLAEQENRKMLELLEKIACKVGVELCEDAEVKALSEAIKPENLAQQIEKTIAGAAVSQTQT